MLFIRAEGGIDVLRGEGVGDDLWLRVLAEWGSSGAFPSERITVPVDRFLGRLAWLRPACVQHRVGIEVDAATRWLIASARREREALECAIAGETPLSPDEVTRLLSRTRFRRRLMPFQLRDLGQLLALTHGANFSVPGAGKTTVMYACYEVERTRGRLQRMLVVAPISAFEAWTTESTACMDPEPVVAVYGSRRLADVEVLVVNYQRLASSYDEIAGWVSEAPTGVVIDEAHRMKRGWTGQWGAACLSLAYLAERRDVLTGTPAPQGLSDLAAVLGFPWPNSVRRLVPMDAQAPNASDEVTDRVATIIRPLFTRTTKDELHLPALSHRVIEVPLQDLHREIYNALLDRYAGVFPLGRADRVSFAQMGEVLMYLLEAATNPALLPRGAAPQDAAEFRHPPLAIPPNHPLAALLAEYEAYETPRKFVELARLVEANSREGRKTLVWSNFVRNLETLRSMLARLEPAVVHGGVPSRWTARRGALTRDDEIIRFRTDHRCMVLLANPAALGEGVSLHDVCKDAVYLDRTFNAGQYLQSVDRVHRLGLQSTDIVRVTYLLTVGTIDEVVDDRVRRKAERLGRVLSDPGIATLALPDEDYYGPALDPDDVNALFTHLRTPVPELHL